MFQVLKKEKIEEKKLPKKGNFKKKVYAILLLLK